MSVREQSTGGSGGAHHGRRNITNNMTNHSSNDNRRSGATTGMCGAGRRNHKVGARRSHGEPFEGDRESDRAASHTRSKKRMRRRVVTVAQRLWGQGGQHERRDGHREGGGIAKSPSASWGRGATAGTHSNALAPCRPRARRPPTPCRSLLPHKHVLLQNMRAVRCLPRRIHVDGHCTAGAL